MSKRLTSHKGADAKASPRRRIIVVLGMHRSGSSALTRGLKALGVSLGDNLMQPAPGNNEKGFWEDLDIYHFNERLLARADSAWHKLTPLDPDAFSGPAFSAERIEAARLLSQKIAAADIFAFKDPRTAVLMPFWRCVFDDLDLDVRYLLTVRHPLESAASLLARDGFPLAKGVILWAKHVVEAVRASKGAPRLFVDYGRLMDAPEAELARIADAFDLIMPSADSEALRDYLDEFLTPSLRHNIIPRKELARSGLAPPFVIDLYDLASDWAEAPAGASADPDPDRWRAIVAGYDMTAPLFRFADVSDDARQTAEQQLKIRSEEKNRLDAALSEQRAELERALEEKNRLDAAFHESNDRLNELRRSNAQEIGLLQETLESERAARKSDLDLLRRQHADEAQNWTRQNETFQRERNAAIADLKAARETLDAVNHHLEEETSLRHAAELAAKSLIAEAEAAKGLASEKSAALTQSENLARELSSERDALRADRKARTTDQLLLRAEIAAIRRSTSWRITAPLRAAGFLLRDPSGAARAIASAGIRGVWRRLPASAERRGKFASYLFKRAPWLVSWSAPYKKWRAAENAPSPLPPDEAPLPHPPAQATSGKIIVVTHDLYRHGAQYLALNMMRTLKARFGFTVAAISGGGGDLAAEFEALGPLGVLDRARMSAKEIDESIARLAADGFSHALVNSAASGWIAPFLARHGVAMVGLVHELPKIIEEMKLDDGLRALDAHARAVVFPAIMVRDQTGAIVGESGWRNPVIAPQGVYKNDGAYDLREKERARRAVENALALPPGARFVLAVGYADRRKGPDIFIDWAIASAQRWPDAYFIWLGNFDPATKELCDGRLKETGDRGARIRFAGFSENTRDYYLGADLYLLTSREDPFPSTALEALNAATPVIMVKGCGGIEDLAGSGAVRCARSAAAQDFVSVAAEWLDDPSARLAAGLAGRDVVRARFGFTSYVGALADHLGAGRPNISVVVPNFNYARYLEQRLQSILDQTSPPREIIFLDDASTDDSVAYAEKLLAGSSINWRIIRNVRNSGDVFAQWRKGVALASGEFVWIAEADDWADVRFLETAARPFARPDVVMSFTQSHQADGAGAVTAPNYLDYVRDVSPDRWRSPYIAAGEDEARFAFSIKNTAPNVSACLFRRAALAHVLSRYAEDIASYRVAGDWCVYANLMREGAIAFDSAPLNYHRRHDASVTISRFGVKELSEIARMQAYVARSFQPDEERRSRARAYLDSLVKNFSLESRFSRAAIDAALRGEIA